MDSNELVTDTIERSEREAVLRMIGPIVSAVLQRAGDAFGTPETDQRIAKASVGVARAVVTELRSAEMLP